MKNEEMRTNHPIKVACLAVVLNSLMIQDHKSTSEYYLKITVFIACIAIKLTKSQLFQVIIHVVKQ